MFSSAGKAHKYSDFADREDEIKVWIKIFCFIYRLAHVQPEECPSIEDTEESKARFRPAARDHRETREVFLQRFEGYIMSFKGETTRTRSCS